MKDPSNVRIEKNEVNIYKVCSFNFSFLFINITFLAFYLADELVDKLANYLLTSLCDLWLKRLLPYGVLGFAENSMDKYEYLNPKAATRKPFYY